MNINGVRVREMAGGGGGGYTSPLRDFIGG